MITLKALSLFRNTNFLLSQVNRNYEGMFSDKGGQIGSTVRIRVPAYYTVRTTMTASAQNTTESYKTLTIDSPRGIDVNFTSTELALSLNSFGEQVLAPMVNTLASACSTSVFNTIIASQNVVSTNATDFNNRTLANVSPTAKSWLLSGAALDKMNAPRGNRTAILSPDSQANAVDNLSGYFNSSREISEQFRTGYMAMGVLGIERWGVDQQVPTVTTGTATTAAMSGASQTGPTITISALSGTLKRGQFVTIAGVNSCNRISLADTGSLMQFVLTADANNGATSLAIAPTMLASAGGTVAGANVTALPGASAVITPVTAESTVTRQNLVFHKEAITICFVDLPIPSGAVTYSRRAFDGVSMRMINYYDGTTDVNNSRLDVLYGTLLVRPEWACLVSDIVD